MALEKKMKIGLSNDDKDKMSGEVYEKVKDDLKIVNENLNNQFQSLQNNFNEVYNREIEMQNNRINNLVGGSPKGVYENLSDLQAAYPNGTAGVYLTINNGHWFYWNGVKWADGGLYQAAEPEIIEIEREIHTVDSFVNYLNANDIDITSYKGKISVFESIDNDGFISDFIVIITDYEGKAILMKNDRLYSLTIKDNLYKYNEFSNIINIKIDDNINTANDLVDYLNNNNFNTADYLGNIIILTSYDGDIWPFMIVPTYYGNGGLLISDNEMYYLNYSGERYELSNKYVTDYETGKLADLKTSNKENLVSAINELFNKDKDALTPTIVEELPETGEINKLYIKKVPNTEKEAQFIYDGHTFDAPEIPSGYYLTMIGDNDAMSIHLASTDGTIQMDIDLNKYYLCCVSKNGTIFTGYSGIQRFGGEPDIGEYTTITPSTNNIKWYTIKKSDVEHSLWELVAEKVFALYRYSEPTYKINVVATTCPRGTGNFIYNMDASVDDLYFSYNSSLYTNIPIGHDYGSYQLEFINLIINAYVYEYYLMDGNFLYQLTTSSGLNKAINNLKTEINTTLGDIETLLSEV